jgi:acyl carrier protein
VREYLRHKLPDYMTPSALVVLDELPLTPSGKVDRRVLPAPDRNRDERKDTYRSPRTPTEQTLAVIWEEVLKLDRVGADDNFFDLGGHSLLATQVVSRIRLKFYFDLPLQQMFASPTIAEIAAILDQNQITRANDTKAARMLDETEATAEEDAREIIEI